MKLRNPFLAVLTGSAFALSGCASFVGGELAPAGQPTTTLIVINNTGMTINALTISKCNAMSHGLNRFGPGQYIPNGGRMRFTITAGCWDVMAGSTTGSAASNQRYTARLDTIQEIEFGPVQ
ncbi:MAG: hypothetical protein ACAH11_01255 [Sphingomonas sp.]